MFKVFNGTNHHHQQQHTELHIQGGKTLTLISKPRKLFHLHVTSLCLSFWSPSRLSWELHDLPSWGAGRACSWRDKRCRTLNTEPPAKEQCLGKTHTWENTGRKTDWQRWVLLQHSREEEQEGACWNIQPWHGFESMYCLLAYSGSLNIKVIKEHCWLMITDIHKLRFICTTQH